MLKKSAKNIIIIIMVAFLLSGSLFYYFDYSMKSIRQDYEARILGLNRQLSANLQSMQQALEHQIGNISSQIGVVDANLQNFKKQNQQEINTLSSLIDQIEKQSDIQLKELKDELKNIRIQTADFSAIVDDVLQSVVSVNTDRGLGSGVIIDGRGYIATNVHIISGATTIRVMAYSGKKYNVNVIGYDEASDIAVLKVGASDLKALNFGDSDEVKVGEKVIAAGNPAGLAFTVTEGIVSAFRVLNNVRYIQTDVPINPGNSGGPLVNTKGEIIGINNFKIGGFESLGFAISSNNVKNVVNKIITEYESKQNP